MDCLFNYPHLTILSTSPSLPANSDGLHHLALRRGWGLQVVVVVVVGSGWVKFTESVELYTQLCLRRTRKKTSENCLKTRRCSDLFVISIADNVHFPTNECMREIKFGHVAIQGLWAY